MIDHRVSYTLTYNAFSFSKRPRLPAKDATRFYYVSNYVGELGAREARRYPQTYLNNPSLHSTYGQSMSE